MWTQLFGGQCGAARERLPRRQGVAVADHRHQAACAALIRVRDRSAPRSRSARHAIDGFASTKSSTFSRSRRFVCDCVGRLSNHTGQVVIVALRRAQRPVWAPGVRILDRPPIIRRRSRTSSIAQIRANDRDRGPARYREQIAERKAREEAGERDGWDPGGYRWRKWDHLKEERRRTEIETQGCASVADLYE